MSTLALARKYRPRDFASVAVQSHVSNTLKGAIARGRVAHGYLLCGPRGTGKTTLARVLAMALNCETRAERRADDGEPCGRCESCQRIWSGSSSLDVVEMDAASNRSVDDARELRERAMYAPTGDDRYKVYIVDEAHMLTREAWNALLKVLEEPPPRVVFVFCTTEPQKIAQLAAPILSRLQRFDLRRIGPAEIRERLAAVLDQEDVPYEVDALGMIARAADGGLRDALSLADQVISLGAEPEVTAERVREALGLVPEDEYVAMLDVIIGCRPGEVFASVERLAEAGVDFTLFLGGFADLLRALLTLTLGGAPSDLSERAREALAERVGQLSAADLLRMLHLVVEAEPRFRRSGQQQLLLETLLVRFALLERTVGIEDVLRGLATGGVGESGPGGTSMPGPGAAAVGARPSPVDAAARSALRQSPPAAGPAPSGPPASSAGRASAGASAAAGETGRSSAGPASFRAAFDAAVAEHGPAGVPARPAAPPRGGAIAVLERPAAAPPLAAPLAPPLAPPKPLAPVGTPTPDPIRNGGAAPAPQVGAPSGAPGAAGQAADSLAQLAARWDHVVDFARAARPLVGSALASARPLSADAGGLVIIELQESNDTLAQTLEMARDDVLAAVRIALPGAARVVVRAPAVAAPPPERLTAEGIRADRLASLSRRDPVLGAAIEHLDLDLLD